MCNVFYLEDNSNVFSFKYACGLYLLKDVSEINPSGDIEAENVGCWYETPNPLEQKLTEFKQFNNNIFPIWKKILFSFQKIRMVQGMNRHSRKSRIQQLWLN